MENRFIACIVLHALGDTIGFKNSQWEFIKSSSIESSVLEKIYDFVDLGGINYVPQKNWLISDDTIMHVAVAKSLLKKFETIDQYATILVKNFLKAYKIFEKDYKKRFPGKALMIYLERLDNGGKWDNTPYDYYAGGSGASMRSSCIGLAYYGKENRHKLIQISIESSRITHNSAVGYLGGMTTALFTAFAIENIEIKKWPQMLLDILKSSVISNYIKKTGRGYKEYIRDSHIFIEKWTKYVEDKFNSEGEPIKRRSNKNLIYRTKYYFDNFGFKDQENVFFPGSGGDDSVIIAYDSLFDSGKNWEKLVFYSMLHGGDTDTTGCIAASWYGVMYEFGEVPLHRIDLIENKDELFKIGKKLFTKFYK